MILFALIFLLVGVLLASQQKTRQKTNRPPSIESFTSSLRVVPICPFSSLVPKPEVELFVNATDPDNDTLFYEYSANEGSISGKGRLVVWNLDRLSRGLHEVRVTVTDGKGGKVDAALIVITADHTACDPPPPPCPVVKVSIP
jgi:hypothetical protein